MAESVGKSMKAGELAESQKGCWRKIAITLIDRVVSVIALFQQLLSAPTTGQ